MKSSPEHFSEIELYHFFSVAMTAVKAAEIVILKYFFQKDLAIELKSDSSPVTQADREAETIIREIIHIAFSTHGIMGEEEKSINPDSPFQWVIDPIDGTKSFSRHRPFFATELALTFKGNPIVAISHAPVLQRTAHAIKGSGAFINNEQVHLSKTSTLNSASISISSLKYLFKKGFGGAVAELSQVVRDLRGYGDTWSYHYLAEGNLDGIVEAQVSFWDIAAMWLIITEAGGRVTDLQGNEITAQSTSFAATNGIIHTEMLKHFNNTSKG